MKISFCATLCHVAYHALDYPGISTAVTTVLVAGLTSTGAMKQKLAHRVVGSIVGGLFWGSTRCDLRSNPRLLTVRSTLSSHLENLAESVEKNRDIEPTAAERFDEPQGFPDTKETEYTSTMASRYKDIESILGTLHPDGSQTSLLQEPGNAPVRQQDSRCASFMG